VFAFLQSAKYFTKPVPIVFTICHIMVQQRTPFDYKKLLSTAESIQHGWLILCQRSALFILDGQLESPAALDIVGLSSVVLNISACIGSFVLLGRLEEIPYRAVQDSKHPLERNFVISQHRIHAIGALRHWVVWHWLCFTVGAYCTFAQVLLYIWSQESKGARISLTILAGFTAMPLVALTLVPFANIFRARGDEDQISDTDSMSSRAEAEGALRSPSFPLSISTHLFPSIHTPRRHPLHRPSGAPPFHREWAPVWGRRIPMPTKANSKLTSAGMLDK